MEQIEKPNWYWTRGLFDAEVLDVHVVEVSYDYKQRNPIRNFLSIKLNSRQAMNDTSIREIRLFNAKILSDSFECVGYWWVRDRLEKEGNKFLISIELRNSRCSRTIVIRFDDAIVLRN